jgi:hypothetical protein
LEVRICTGAEHLVGQRHGTGLGRFFLTKLGIFHLNRLKKK